MNEEDRGARSAVAGQQTEVAVLAGGCFWGVEEILRAVPGVLDTDVGYTGGWLPNPTYDDTHDSKSGHAEAIRVTFDPSVLSYEDLLERWFFRLHDPTTLNRQGNDVGTQYRSAIFPQSEEQRAAAERVKARVEASGKWKRPITTSIEPAGHVVQRGGVPPGLPAEASGRVQLPLPAGLGERPPAAPGCRRRTGYMSSSGRTSHSPSNAGQCTRCSSMNSRATFRASSFEATSTSA